MLADVFENFRKVCMDSMGLDPAYYLSLPQYSWDCLLKYTKQELELLTDPEQFKFYEKGIRGGVSIITKRKATANNKYMSNYDTTKESDYILYLDANSLYPAAMSKYLPYGGVEWDTDNWINLNVNEAAIKIVNLSENSEVGYTFEVDLKYPRELHETHDDYPFCPESLQVTDDMLSPYCKNIKSKLNIKTGKTKKLIQSLQDKTNYVLSYQNLKQALLHGLELVKIHRVVKFKQSAWMKPYMDFNIRKRQESHNDFEKNFFKLMMNSVFGKTMENVRKYVKCIVVTDPEKCNELTCKKEYLGFKIINENTVLNFSKPLTVKLNKPIFIGQNILDISKTIMYEFHYDVMKAKYGKNAQLLFTDTDSLMYDIKTEDVYEDLESIKDKFDFSDYPKDSKLYSTENKKLAGKFKDEANGKQITEFTGHRAKEYCIKFDDGKQKPTAKGIKEKFQKEKYDEVLEQSSQEFSTMTSIRSKNHQLGLYDVRKIGLSSYDDKRHISDDGVTSHAYGYNASV